jgi:hypothetical protein
MGPAAEPAIAPDGARRERKAPRVTRRRYVAMVSILHISDPHAHRDDDSTRQPRLFSSGL